ncbi:PPR repeat [Musa troglodytarum]|uniref:PPR repeat n=1 Tax=Musa troglodytarum TaxID=320322 RepID=A0A9E7EAR3_9LILI|nr:PPR repeat [Musa troglodytarum]URD73477.1 PPR repeat [Musa troglodytarum]
MILANGPIGVLNTHSNLSSSHGRLPVPQKPLFGRALSLRLAKNWNFDAGSTKCRLCCALANEEDGSGSAASRFIEKELKFSPAFSDYVKVLESVRVDRNSGGDEDKNGSKQTSIAKGKSFRMKRQLHGSKDDDCEERAHVEENGLRREMIDHRRRNKDLKDGAGLIRNKSDGGWALIEGLLEKGSARRNGDMGKGKPGKNKYRSNSKALRKFDSQSNVNDVGENQDNGHLENGKVRYSARLKDMQQKEQKAAWVDKLETFKGNNVKMERNNSMFAHGNHTKSNSRQSDDKNFSGDFAGDQIGNINDNHSYRSKEKKKTHGYETNNCRERVYSIGSSVQRKSGEPAFTKDALKANSSYENNTSKKSFGYDLNKNNIEDESHLKMDPGERQTSSGRSRIEFEFKDDFDGQNIRVNKLIGKQINHVDHSVKQNHFASFKISNEQDRNKWHVGMHNNNYGATKIHRKVNMDSNNITGDVDGYDSEDRTAFKTFEVFTDVRNRPRVLRMEMEERIEKLAKQLNATDINMPQWKFSKIIHSAKIKFTDHSILRIVQILGALGNWKRVLQVVEWLQSHARFESYKSRYIYTTVLDVLGKAKRPIEALNIFYTMRQGLSSYPDLAAYYCIAVTLGQAGLMKELFDVIDCMRAVPEKKFNLGPLQKWDPRIEPDLIVFNAVLNACVQRKQWEGAFWVLKQLKQQGIKPSNTTYGLVMEVMLACGKYNLVYEFFRKVEKKSIPGALNYRVLVQALWREGKIDEAVLAVKDMERRGIVGTASLYYDLARCLCSAGRCQEALLQIDKICKVAKKPLVVTYTGLIKACLDSGSIENGAFVFNQMHKFCSPNIVTYNIMLKSYLNHGMFEEAKDLFQKILDGSHQITYRGDLSQKVVPDKFTFNTMIEACAQTQKWDDFENAYEQMLNHGYHFNTRRHLHMVLDAFRAGKVQVLESIWNHLVRFGRVPPPPIIKERFAIKLMEDDPVAAIACIDIHQEIDMLAFSERSWLKLLNGNAHRFKSGIMLRLAIELDAFIAQTSESLPVYENLRKACEQFVAHANIIPSLPDHLEESHNL